MMIKKMTIEQFLRVRERVDGLEELANELGKVKITDDDELDELYATFLQSLEEIEWRLENV